MKFAIDPNHFEFFEKNQYIEFDSLLTEKELEGLHAHLPEALLQSNPLHKKSESLSAENQFFTGHDLHYIDPFLRKVVMKRQWAEFASTLIQQKPLRLGYDQFFPGTALLPPSKENFFHSYAHLLETNQSLEQISSIQDVLCGLMLCVKSPKNNSEQKEGVFFTLKEGNGVFLGPKVPIHFFELTRRLDYHYLLVTYISHPAVYILNEQDPHGRFLKNYGYTYGDKLKEKFHPIVYR
jgi:hypothetical protein